jgi:uncharacterized membrane protein YqiK
MAGYKDDLDAAHARIRALERELEAKRGPATPALPLADARPRRPRPRSGALLLLPLLPIGLVAALSRQPIVWILIATAGLTLLALLAVLPSVLVIARPCELVAISGRGRHRLLTGRRSLCQPLLEHASPPLDLSVMLLEETTRDVLCREGERVELRWYALASVGLDPSRARSAVERFLGRERQEIARAAAETFEGGLRVVLAELRVEEAQRDRLKLAARLRAALEEDLDKLGLEVHGCGILELRRAG